MAHQTIQDLLVFSKFEAVADSVWQEVDQWPAFAKQNIGNQLVKSADSVGANLVEGDARYSPAESIHFFYIARGSAVETQLWISRAVKRKLIQAEQASELLVILDEATQLLNRLINYRKEARSSGVPDMVREGLAPYGGDED